MVTKRNRPGLVMMAGFVLMLVTGFFLTVICQTKEGSAPATELTAPTAISQALVETVDAAGGPKVSRAMALLIVGLPIIFLYRVLQWAGGLIKIPVGKAGLSLLSVFLAIILGSEAAWKNRVLASGVPPDVAKDQKTTLLKKLGKDHPLVSAELKKVTDEMYNRSPRFG